MAGEDRSLFVVPRHLRVRPSDEDALNRGMRLVKLRFELPRGSYATLVVKRLLVRGQRLIQTNASTARQTAQELMPLDPVAHAIAAAPKADEPRPKRSGRPSLLQRPGLSGIAELPRTVSGLSVFTEPSAVSLHRVRAM